MLWPAAWADIPHRNRTALLDFGGTHALAHRVIAETAARNGFPYQTFDLGDNVLSPEWQAAHQQEHVNANQALGISGPPAMTDVNPNDPVQFHQLMFIIASEHIRLNAAAGLI